jgi:hypothetical protein
VHKALFPLAFVASAALATSAAAQSLDDVTVEAGLSTLGFYIAPKIEIAPSITARAPIYLGSYSDTFDLDGNDVRGKLTSNSVALMGDYALGNAGFRLSAGVSVGGYELEGRASTLTIEGNTYTGDFTAKLKQKRNVAPVIAVGYARTLGDNWGFVAELGARITSLEVSTTGQDQITNPAERAQFDADLAQVNRDLRDMKVVPFLTLGVSYKF